MVLVCQFFLLGRLPHAGVRVPALTFHDWAWQNASDPESAVMNKEDQLVLDTARHSGSELVTKGR
jgi:hypothetical protein